MASAEEYYVKNINNTSDPRYQGRLHESECEYWIKMWKKAQGWKDTDVAYCSRHGCSENDGTDGAHVQFKRDAEAGDIWWIIPMCRGCNNSDEELRVTKMAYDSKIPHKSPPETYKCSKQ
eukprot:scpid100007/ scgid1030/ 